MNKSLLKSLKLSYLQNTDKKGLKNLSVKVLCMIHNSCSTNFLFCQTKIKEEKAKTMYH